LKLKKNVKQDLRITRNTLSFLCEGPSFLPIELLYTRGMV